MTRTRKLSSINFMIRTSKETRSLNIKQYNLVKRTINYSINVTINTIRTTTTVTFNTTIISDLQHNDLLQLQALK